MLPLILSAVGVLAGANYLKKKDSALASPAGPLTKGPGSTSSSPGTTFPFSVPQAPRNDNQNQPWTQAARAYAGSPAGQAAIQNGINSGLQSLGDLWHSMTSGASNDAGASPTEADLGPAIDATAMDTNSAASDLSAGDSGGGNEAYGWDDSALNDTTALS